MIGLQFVYTFRPTHTDKPVRERSRPWRRNDEVCSDRHTATHHQTEHLAAVWRAKETLVEWRWSCTDDCHWQALAILSTRARPLHTTTHRQSTEYLLDLGVTEVSKIDSTLDKSDSNSKSTW